MAFVPDTQQGATAAYTGLTMDIVVDDIPAITRKFPTIAIPHLGSVTQVPYIAGDLCDVDPFDLRFQNDGSSTKPTDGSTYVLTITAPLAAGDSSAEYWAGSVIVTGVSSPAFAANANDLQRIIVGNKPSGVGTGSGTLWSRTPAA